MDMVASQRRYWKLTGVCLKIVGIWPDQKKSSQYFLRSVVYIVMMSSILAQIAHVVCFFDLETLTNQVFSIVTSSMAVMKHVIYSAKYSKFKVLLDDMVNDLKMAKANDELDVMTPYMNRGIFMATSYAYAAIAIVMVFIQVPLVPRIADIVKPLNKSRPPVDAFHLYYYFVDIDEHHYSTMLHTDITVIVIACAAVACDNFYVYTVHHACGLFDVAGYRFKNAIEDIPDARTTVDTSNETYRKVCHSIKAHNHAIRYVREIDSFYCGYLFIYVTITVIGLSTSLLWLSKLRLSEELYVHVASSFTDLCQIVFVALPGQFVINSTDDVYKQICEGLWYNSAPKTQVLFILALTAAVNPPEITGGGLIPINIQTFAEVMKLSFSYCMVLKSV